MQTHTTKPQTHASTLLQSANFGLVILFWAIFCYQLSYEWAINDQYNYGLFVPFIALYLLHLRWLDRPKPEPSKLSPALLWACLAVTVLLHYPIKIIFEANADWRMIIWTQALLVLAITYLLIYQWGGKAWLVHAIWPFLFLLTAVPWPTFLEKEFVRALMGVIASITVEVVNFIGIHARQAGNIIYLTNGVVSIEEACSGIRSFQSTIMAGLLLGELLRFQINVRLLFVFLAGCFALFFNFCRTLYLTLQSATQGTEMMQQWHDSAGYAVFILSFIALAILAYFFNKLYPNKAWKKVIKERTRSPFISSTHPQYLALPVVIVFGLFLVVSEPAVRIWYGLRQADTQSVKGWQIDWSKGTTDLTHNDISPQIKSVLHYDIGQYVEWKSEPNLSWMAYFLQWDNARSAQLGGVHNPEICLPATGWTLTEKGDDFLWKSKDGPELMFNSYQFKNPNNDISVFYCQWDPAGYPYHTKSGRYRNDRLTDAWIGDRKSGKQKLEIIIRGSDSLATAKAALIDFLNVAVKVH